LPDSPGALALAASVVTILANGLLIRFVPDRTAAGDTAN